MRPTNPENFLTRCLAFLKTRGIFKMEIFIFKKLGKISKPTPKTETDSFHEKMKVVQH
jgi:hypothetical protein